MFSVTRLPGSAVPEKTRVRSRVSQSLDEAPVSSEIPLITGAAGAVKSTTTTNGFEFALVLPATSVATAITS